MDSLPPTPFSDEKDLITLILSDEKHVDLGWSQQCAQPNELRYGVP